ncbi:hypothetical protein AB6878_11845 [Carnobacterium maltaromaticum]|uniref:hypothetical protein n=1 Tax=Carnobacterium maltaromaticum TaxID=2751 RepID=UPI0039BDC0E9
MRTLVRTTLAGNEYWDNKEKRIIFVPDGEAPGFEVTENPESMIAGKETEKLNDPVKAKVAEEESSSLDLDSMSTKQLKEYADVNEIEIPNKIKTKKEIAEFIRLEMNNEILPV